MTKGVKIAKLVVIGILAIGIFGYVTQLLWNWLVPALFNGPSISFWQALGLLALSKLLTWGFMGGRHRNGSWSSHWKAKWARMTPEERAQLKARMQEKWCRPPQTTPGDRNQSQTPTA